MFKVIQLDFFEKDEMSLLKAEVEAVKKSGDKVRRGTYARINELEAMVKDLQERMCIIEKNICSNKKPGGEFPLENLSFLSQNAMET